MKDIDLFSEVSVLVLGDLIMDQFIYGNPDRISREAPVLILEETARQINPGGAGNAAVNIASLGGDARLAALVGDDGAWSRLGPELADKDVCVSSTHIDENLDSAVKTRIMAGSDQIVRQQIVRLDSRQKGQVKDVHRQKLYGSVAEIIDEIDVVLFSDYGLGLFKGEFISRLVNLCRSHAVPMVADSRYQLLDFAGVTIATPNLEEAGRAVESEIEGEEEVVAAGREILSSLQSDFLLLTRGKEGMTLLEAGGDYEHIPASNRLDVYDVTGAGDTVAAAVALGIGAGLEVLTAVKLANAAAGVAITKEGAAPVFKEELKEVVYR